MDAAACFSNQGKSFDSPSEKAKNSDSSQQELSAQKHFCRWKVSSPAQGVYSAVRTTPANPHGSPREPAVTEPTNKTVIQLLQKIKCDKYLQKYITNAITELKRPGVTVKSSDALNKLVNSLVLGGLEHKDNIGILDQLLELGCSVPCGAISFGSELMNVNLIKKLCAHSENPKAFIRKNTLRLLSLGTKEGYQLLTAYLSEQDIIEIVQKTDLYSVSELIRSKGMATMLPDICPAVVALLWKALLPNTLGQLEQMNHELGNGNTAPFKVAKRSNHEGVLLETLIWLDYHYHPETLSKLLAELPEKHRHSLSLISLSLGLENVFGCLARTNIPSLSKTDTGLLHKLLHLTRGAEDLALNVEIYTTLENLFRSFGISPDDLNALASQRDEKGRLPLQVLLEDRLDCAKSDPFFLMDDSRFQSWFGFLLQHTPKEALPQCLEGLLSSAEPKNINYYAALLKFIKADCNLAKVHNPVKKGSIVNKWTGDLPDSNDDSSTLQALLNHFRKFPGTLLSADSTEQMIQKLSLSPAFQAVTLLAMEPKTRLELLSIWRNRPDRLKALFFDQSFSLKEKNSDPWLPFMVIMQHDLPNPSGTQIAAALEQHVQEYQERIKEDHCPELPGELMEHWQNSEQLDLYGRSLRLGKRLRQASDTGDHPVKGIRLKFRKQELEPEPWSDFTREQAVLSFFNQARAPLTLDSQLLQQQGVYRLPKTCDLLSRECFVPEAFQTPLKNSVHINPDGSAYVQVLEDTPGTEHYHHYPYLIDPASGLTRENAFEGIRLYCKDSGKLWQMGIKSPDAIGIFHNNAGSKPWNPFPGYSLRRQGLFCARSLFTWNRQIPDIAHAPAGMRDYQGVMAMDKLPDDIYGERRLDWSDPLDMRRGRLTELGKQFYGVTLNWLRVRHDINELDHKNPEHLKTLSNELVILYTDLFSNAFNSDVKHWQYLLRNVLPAETLQQATRECLYWCSPQHPYVADIRNNRYPSEVYPGHKPDDLKCFDRDLYDGGFKSHPDAAGSDLGNSHVGNMVLHHLAAIFWFGVMEGVLTQTDTTDHRMSKFS